MTDEPNQDRLTTFSAGINPLRAAAEPIMHKLYFADPPWPDDPRPYEEKEAQVVAFWDGLCADGSMPMKEALPASYALWVSLNPEERRRYVENHVKWANVDMR